MLASVTTAGWKQVELRHTSHLLLKAFSFRPGLSFRGSEECPGVCGDKAEILDVPGPKEEIPRRWKLPIQGH